jgi:hypothetical protein
MPVPMTRDLGLAIRDVLEMPDQFETFEEREGELTATGTFEIAGVDVSDPDNLIVETWNGEKFRVSIVRVG